ncbi:MAG: biopolymer transporter ExbD [Pseudomonadota bacterium]
MKIRDEARERKTSDESILPLINVVFLLLIFFMIAGTLADAELFDINPPISESNGEHNKDTLTILISKNMSFGLNNRAINKETLLFKVQQKMLEDKEYTVTLKVDNSLPANDVVAFTRELNQQGVQTLRLLTEPL